MKRIIQIVGVLTLLFISVYVSREFRRLASEYYNINYSLIGIVINLAIYQICYWLIEKLDKLIQLRKKGIYLIGVLIVMFMLNVILALFFYRFLFLLGVPFTFFDPTFMAILIFIISTLIGNVLLKKLESKS
jgi:hypothetical protein